MVTALTNDSPNDKLALVPFSQDYGVKSVRGRPSINADDSRQAASHAPRLGVLCAPAIQRALDFLVEFGKRFGRKLR